MIKNRTKKRVYLDYASTTPLDKRVKKAMDRFLDKDFGNAGSIYKEGMEAKKALGEARKKIAGVFKCKTEEIIFTSGGTESNNLAIIGVMNAIADLRGVNTRICADLKNFHIITTQIEHSSVLQCFKKLEKKGAQVSYIGVGQNGVVNPKDIENALRLNTVLVSVMYANNEIGTIQPIREISKIIKSHNLQTSKSVNLQTYKPCEKNSLGIFPQSGISQGKLRNLQTYFHSDASQAACYLDLNVERLGVDLMTIDGHKIYGPKGVGALFVKKGTTISKIMEGGEQEMDLRPGTEPIPLIVGLSEALVIADSEREKEFARLSKLRDYFYSQILKNLRIDTSGKKEKKIELNGEMENRLPNNLNIYVPGIDAEFAVIKLDEKGIACSAKSACLKDGSSYVVNALNLGKERGKQSLRFSLGRFTTKSEIDYAIKVLKTYFLVPKRII
ncbi:MAG: cysteine desulfurase family protein [Candidatus Paceibacterota bacterium]|jgi:cysteine desulfurase